MRRLGPIDVRHQGLCQTCHRRLPSIEGRCVGELEASVRTEVSKAAAVTYFDWPADANLPALCSDCLRLTLPEALFLQNQTHFCDWCYRVNEDNTAAAHWTCFGPAGDVGCKTTICSSGRICSASFCLQSMVANALPGGRKTWISSAVAAGLVVEYKMNKNKHICLARLNNEAVSPFPPDSVDTTLEEDFETSCRTRPEVASLD